MDCWTTAHSEAVKEAKVQELYSYRRLSRKCVLYVSQHACFVETPQALV